jgi:hypothetical protein
LTNLDKKDPFYQLGEVLINTEYRSRGSKAKETSLKCKWSDRVRDMIEMFGCVNVSGVNSRLPTRLLQVKFCDESGRPQDGQDGGGPGTIALTQLLEQALKHELEGEPEAFEEGSNDMYLLKVDA